MKKIAFITGATGGIGGAFASYMLSQGFETYLPVRNIGKLSSSILKNPLAHSFEADIISRKDMANFCRALEDVGVVPSVVILSAGTFAWDTEFSNEMEAIDELTKINFTSKKLFINVLESAYTSDLKKTTLILLGSHAGHFIKTDPRRKNEEGYVKAMLRVYLFGQELRKKKIFKKVIMLEPGLVDTPLARQKFTKETIGEEPNWKKIPSAKKYVSEVLKNVSL